MTDNLPGGRADEFQVRDLEPLIKKLGVRYLERAIAVEMEHTDSRAKALEIVLDHIEESLDYYWDLCAMEAEY